MWEWGKRERCEGRWRCGGRRLVFAVGGGGLWVAGWLREDARKGDCVVVVGVFGGRGRWFFWVGVRGVAGSDRERWPVVVEGEGGCERKRREGRERWRSASGGRERREEEEEG